MENKCISALNYIRSNRKASLDEVYNLFGSDGSFVFHTFQARYCAVRKQKDGRNLDDKCEEVIDEIIAEFDRKTLKSPSKEAKRQKLITNILIGVVAAVSAVLFFIFGWAIILLVPPIWIIIFVVLWILKKT